MKLQFHWLAVYPNHTKGKKNVILPGLRPDVNSERMQVCENLFHCFKQPSINTLVKPKIVSRIEGYVASVSTPQYLRQNNFVAYI